MTRPVTDALGGMVRGALAGLFDGPTTVRPDFGAPVQTVDLSRMANRGDETVAMILACVSSWAQAAIDAPGPARMIVRDELWRRLRSPRWSARSTPTCGYLAPRAPSRCWPPTGSATSRQPAPAGSPEAAIASNLIASCDTRVCLRQDTAPLAQTREQIGLTDVECAHIASWSGQHVGRAVWKVGRSASVVAQLVLTPAEQQLFFTNQRMGV